MLVPDFRELWLLMNITVYHNPRCSKSRATLDLLAERGIEPRIVEYLRDPPSPQALAELVAALGIGPRELLRTGEEEYRELGLDDAGIPDDQILRAISRYPRLMQRPIVVCEHRARIGRPPENVLEILP